MKMIIICLVLVPLMVLAERGGASGSGRISGDQCPFDTLYEIDKQMVFSPFKPYWEFNKEPVGVQYCWVVSDCLFEATGESRKQQFAATALVMGLIALTLRDIAWPARRLVFVTNNLPWFVEVLVLSLGLVPMKTGNTKTTRRRSSHSDLIAARAWTMKKGSIKHCILACSGALSLCFGSLAVMEIYSKRSSLGCPAPIFIVTWHMVALLPGIIHSLFANSRRRSYERRRVLEPDAARALLAPNSRLANPASDIDSVSQHRPSVRGLPIDMNDENEEDERIEPTGREREKKMASAIQGANEAWPVQMAWSIYYIAGTLVFTSIMAVTVPELVVWVVLGLTTAACSKILAFFLCLIFEDTGLNRPSAAGSVAQR
jgi:hypothetical protein